MKKNRLLWLAILVIYLLYFVSFFLPAFPEHSYHESSIGWTIFVETFFNIFEAYQWDIIASRVEVWAPNPLLWVGVICLGARRPQWALVAGGAATACAGHILWELEYFKAEELSWGRSGAYVWFGSMLCLALAGLVSSIQQWRQTRRLPMLGEK